jgi:signal transduction histidine kinase
MTLKTKIITGYILFALVAGVVGIIGTLGIKGIEQNFEVLSEDVLPTVKALEDLRFAGLRIVSSVAEHGMLHKYSDAGRHEAGALPLVTERELIEEGLALFRDSFASYESLASKRTDEKGFLQEIRRRGDALVSGADTLIGMMASGKNHREILEGKERFEQEEMAFLEAVSQALGNEYVQLAHEKQKETAAMTATMKRVVVVAFLAVIVGLLGGFTIAARIVKPLEKLKESAELIGKGDLDVLIEASSQDEVGQLAAAFDQMRAEVKTSRDSLLLAKEELEQRVKERTAQLELANSELESFGYTVSHDLRSPLHRIDGFCRLIREESAARLDPDNLLYLEKICSSVSQMSLLIDELLDFSMLSRCELCIQEVDLTGLARIIAADLQLSGMNRQVEFRISEGVTACGDAPLLQVVLNNLLGNAWKYTRHKEQAIIEFGVEELAGVPVYLVRDNGAGFDMHQAGKLFTPFQRLHKASEYEGTGIGLATVQRIVSRHGGRIWGEASPGNGAVFRFTLQEDPEAAATGLPGESSAPQV